MHAVTGIGVAKTLQLQAVEQRDVEFNGIPDFGYADVFIGRVGARRLPGTELQ